MNGNKGNNVSILDDETNAVRVLSEILGEEGYRVLESCDVEGAIKIICKDDVDAVITDLKMPGRDRISLIELPKELLSFSRTAKSTYPAKTLREVMIQAIKDSVYQCNGNKSKAARMIGISRKAFYHRLKEFSELGSGSWN